MSEVNNTLLLQQLSKQIEALKDQHGNGSGPSTPNGGNMEPRVAKLEASVGHIEKDVSDIKTDLRDIRRDVREDFRIVWGGLIALGLGLAGLMAKGFHWL